MRPIGKVVIGGVIVFISLQFVRPGIPAGSGTTELAAPPEVKLIFEKSCYSCHSNQNRLAWFDQIQPAYWFVRQDILTARSHLNFSTLGTKAQPVQRATLYEAVNMIQLGAMPLPRFTWLQPEARVSPEDLALLKRYLAPWTNLSTSSGSRPVAGRKTDAVPAPGFASAGTPVNLATVQPEWNGIRFDTSFEEWTPLSFTDRGDNNTFRLILGNEIAVKAVLSGDLSPWPDGSRFAKIAWQQEAGADGLVHAGDFVQLELMQKDARGYKDTEGWGWGRWRGLDLKPYGKNAQFVGECTGCHRPMQGNDYVYTLPISSHHSTAEDLTNSIAALPASLPHQPLVWNAITMYVDRTNHTMATLYGNEIAFRALRARQFAPAENQAPAYPTGSVLALVTWTQREDPHWFGARIPGTPKSVEFVEVSAEGRNSYRSYTGVKLTEQAMEATVRVARTQFLLNLRPAQLP